MRHVRGLRDGISISIPSDDEGFTGRECPSSECEGYFKVKFGTGLTESDVPCHCPYCGHTASHSQFYTREQAEYIRSIALRTVADAVRKDLKSMEFEQRPSGPFGVGVSLRVRPGRSVPVRHYREKRLETDIKCSACSLQYSVYGVFAFCPDCREHNSLEILESNMDLIGRMVDLADGAGPDVARGLMENALEDCVSAFDGFAREVVRIYNVGTALSKIRFQNLADRTLHASCGVALSASVTGKEWRLLIRGFQKRHVIAHRMGVVDSDYIARTGDSAAVVGRKIRVSAGEIGKILQVIRKIAVGLSVALRQDGRTGSSTR